MHGSCQWGLAQSKSAKYKVFTHRNKPHKAHTEPCLLQVWLGEEEACGEQGNTNPWGFQAEQQVWDKAPSPFTA